MFYRKILAVNSNNYVGHKSRLCGWT